MGNVSREKFNAEQLPSVARTCLFPIASHLVPFLALAALTVGHRGSMLGRNPE
ncbi:hypothetical protein BO86DRAFT_392921 [Aspergillus japonicus CBS 114.51]|uniref:Uncharacterized protein n=1 Tax=Aspergillus japonicus CBS 114.51 TaxID=1448312 RepID=A0A8T8WMT6_ASPJA|nr:hypothetical protein BO86DRAFT_392921 [Aspergillus japonicus CBS 114.51]RAH77111.1 hypothetical protein BO86DRAFT_392921 [Aspergillus japonicus CBS 114.51]